MNKNKKKQPIVLRVLRGLCQPFVWFWSLDESVVVKWWIALALLGIFLYSWLLSCPS